MKTIKDVQFELKLWGKFWARQEEGQGYASKSNAETLREKMRAGCAIAGTSHLVNHRADSIHVPKHIESIGDRLDCLDHKCKTAVRQRYINRGQIRYFVDAKTFLFWINKAEREML